MKNLQLCFASALFLMFFSCKDNNQKLLDNLSGTWKVKQITFSQTGNVNPDSVVKYPNSIFQLDNCRLTGSVRECAGYYNLTGKEKVKITFNATASVNRTFLTVMETFTPSINLLGSYDIKNSSNSMTLSGPQAGSSDYKGRTIVLELNK
jgi:hypothetical protein